MEQCSVLSDKGPSLEQSVAVVLQVYFLPPLTMFSVLPKKDAAVLGQLSIDANANAETHFV